MKFLAEVIDQHGGRVEHCKDSHGGDMGAHRIHSCSKSNSNVGVILKIKITDALKYYLNGYISKKFIASMSHINKKQT